MFGEEGKEMLWELASSSVPGPGGGQGAVLRGEQPPGPRELLRAGQGSPRSGGPSGTETDSPVY